MKEACHECGGPVGPSGLVEEVPIKYEPRDPVMRLEGLVLLLQRRIEALERFRELTVLAQQGDWLAKEILGWNEPAR